MRICSTLMLVLIAYSARVQSAGAAESSPVHQIFAGSAALPAGWRTVSGEWTPSEAGLLAKPAKDGAASLSPGEQAWGDARLEVAFAFQADKPAHSLSIVMRDAGPDSVAVQLTVKPGAKDTLLELSARLRPPEQGWRVLRHAKYAKPLGRENHKVELEVNGAWIRASLDGQAIIRAPRADELAPQGRVSIAVTGVPAVIKEVNVQPADPKEVPQTVRTRPLVAAHRGWSFVAPENTLASYRKAIEAGADLAECDVYTTSDGAVVLLHDRTFKRTAGVDKAPGDLTLAEVKKLDAGRWKSSEYAGEKVPTLREALDLVKGKIRFIVEIKQRDIEEPVVKVIRESGVAPQDLMMFSFYRDVVAKVGQIEPQLPTTWLTGDLPYDETGRRDFIRQALEARCSAIGPNYERVDAEFVRMAHLSGLAVWVWTVDEPEDMRYLKRIGADVIITNKPDVLQKVLAE